MRKIHLGVWLTCVLCACGSTGDKGANDPSSEENYVPASKHYTSQQMGQLTLCTGYGDVLFHVLLRKKEGSTLDAELERHREYVKGKADDGMVEALIQDVYKQPDVGPFQVIDSFYEFCMAELAGVPTGQQAVAQRCLRSTYVSLESYALRAHDVSEARAKEAFPTIDYAAPIVARAYAFDDPKVDYLERANLTHSEWKRCFKEADGA